MRIVTLAALAAAAACPASAAARAWTVVPGTPLRQPALTAVTAVPGTGDAWAAGATYSTTLTPIFEHERGGKWTAVTAPRSGPDSSLSGIAATGPDDVWAVGRREGTAPSSVRTLAEHWDGSHWAIVPTPDLGVDAAFAAVAASGRGIWAVGIASNHPLVERWNGAAWRVERTPAPEDAQLTAVTVVPGSSDVWAVGGRSLADGEQLTVTELRRGGRWRLVPSASGPAVDGTRTAGLTAVAALSVRDVWAAGRGTAAGLLEHWDGRAWHALPGQPADAYPAAAARVGETIWIVGAVAPYAETEETFTERISRGRWRVVPSPSPDQGCEHLDVLSGVAGGGTVWAVGFHFHLLDGCGDAVQGSLILRY